ncbi:hypothetical protein [Meiothermus phage MMP17]|nr:hypothetical protein [Meiothermus phage MMP17]
MIFSAILIMTVCLGPASNGPNFLHYTAGSAHLQGAPSASRRFLLLSPGPLERFPDNPVELISIDRVV